MEVAENAVNGEKLKVWVRYALFWASTSSIQGLAPHSSYLKIKKKNIIIILLDIHHYGNRIPIQVKKRYYKMLTKFIGFSA